MRRRIASPTTPTTNRAPPIAAPIIVPVEEAGSGATTGPAAIPARGFDEDEGESVGPGVSVGVIDGEAPIRREGVGVGVDEGVGEAVTDSVGVGE